MIEKLTWCKLEGITLLCIPFFILLINNLLNLIGVVMMPYIFIMALFCSFVFISYLGRKYCVKKYYLTIISTIIIIFLSIIIALFFYDYSVDGQWYHQWNIYNLAKGWNPVYESCPGNILTTKWSDSYPKGLEIVSASLYSIVGKIEVGKFIGYILCATVFFFAMDFLSEYIPQNTIGIASRIFYSFIIAFPAVVVCQLFTFYVDYSLYVLITILFATCWSLYHERHIKLDLAILFTLCALSISIKFTYGFWVGAMLLPFGGLLCYEKRWRLLYFGICVALISFLIGLIIINFNPYITNLLRGHHLLYPLMGEGASEIISSHIPKFFENLPSIFWPTISLLTDMNWSDFIPIYSGHLAYGMYDCCLGGFGFLFSFIFILSFILIIDARQKNKDYYIVLGLFVYLFISLHILPAGWWARYVSFFALSPTLVLIYVTKYPLRRKWPIRLLTLLLVINIGVSAFFSMMASYSHRESMQTLMKSFNDSIPVQIWFNKNVSHSVEIKMKENSINYYIDEKADSVFHFHAWDVRVAKKSLR